MLKLHPMGPGEVSEESEESDTNGFDHQLFHIKRWNDLPEKYSPDRSLYPEIISRIFSR